MKKITYDQKKKISKPRFLDSLYLMLEMCKSWKSIKFKNKMLNSVKKK